MSRYVVGIDLGTTNSALAHADLERAAAKIEVDAIAQLIGPGEIAARPTLPSFLYLAGEHELAPGALELPWRNADASKNDASASSNDAGASSRDAIAVGKAAVGEFARTQGAHVPGRLVASAKSWLCHPRVDRLAPILPWGEAAEGVKKISPVDASAAYLRHLAGFWRHATGRPLGDEEVVLCVPASFDEVARELTLRAAEREGLRPTLLEEPQAAFYSWLADRTATWRDELAIGDTVLVFDVGGGTTDFSLIRVLEGAGGEPTFERTAVGDHLLLGGDNMDLALARRVEGRLMRGGRLDPHGFQQLVQACRVAKERLLSEPDRAAWSISLAGRGSKLIGGALRDEVARAEVEELVLDGFFPRVGADAAPHKNPRAGIQEFGLPYAADPAITRHAASFLRLHQSRPTAVLWNGGVLKSPAIRARVLEVLASWLGAAPRVLENQVPDLAVARGAAYYGLARRGLGVRITGGAARAYYVGLDTAQVAPGQLTALCLTPRGLEEGAEVELRERELELLTNRPVRFRLFSSSDRVGDRAGDLLTVPADALAELPPIYTVLRFTRSSHDTALAVHLRARLTELGTLELECVARGTGNEQADRWKLNFDLRGAEAANDAPASQNDASASQVDPGKLEAALAVLRALYGKEPPGTAPPQPAGVMKALSSVLGPRDSWPTTALRALWEPLKELRGGRGKSPAHEARWLNLVGYTLRPGFGYPLDDWRVKETWRLFNAGLVHDKDDACHLEWWILWRRVSGGLTKTQQEEVFKRIAPHFLTSFAKKADRRAPGAQETAEMWRAVASMERLTAKQKAELGDVLIAQLEKKKAPEHALWALGRLGARVPLYGPVEDVVGRHKAERWLERLMALEWKGEPFALAAAELARCAGDRARDLDEPLRRRLADRLKALPDGARLQRLVLEPVAREEREERLAFGEALPSGLRLIAG
ncbi:MAG TPA: Hsp70 family protein [Polyangia bacterium]|nr:Hsp70 family protein [Polyangia bacterium]